MQTQMQIIIEYEIWSTTKKRISNKQKMRSIENNCVRNKNNKRKPRVP